ncbi:MAG: peptide-methionine (S)-S-oxide reductase [Methanolobus sp.]|nr:peptide-methionine (S)-S-oxide reductase [Methanolobus sp.]
MGSAGDTMGSREDLLKESNEVATFAAGCFWGVEATFRQVKGVKYTQVGYTGGDFTNPSYKDVCSGGTGHAEAVEIIFDPGVVPYEKLLELFWAMHDPTTPNRQGPDIGSQYRSAVFYHSKDQKEAALRIKRKLQESRQYRKDIVTEIVPADTFYRAEEYHQQYFEKTGSSGGCHIR